MKSSIIFQILYFCLMSVYEVYAQKIFVFSDHYQQGKKLELSISECSNVPDEMIGDVTSINTQDNCVRFYDAKNCSGNSIEIMPRSPHHHNLYYWGFNDRTMSVGPCPHMCDEKVTGKAPQEGERVDLVIFNRKNFKGAYQEINVIGCTLIPTKFVLQMLSTKVYDQCIQFYNNVDCKTSGQGIDTIELRRGTPAHDDISKWWFPESRAVSHCSHKCNETLQEINWKSNRSDATASQQNEVILFDSKFYDGNWKRLIIVDCVDILNEWEGAAMSIKAFNKSCVTLFDKRACTGNTLNIYDSNPDLSIKSFDAIARSMAPCSKVVKKPNPPQLKFDIDDTGNEKQNEKQNEKKKSTAAEDSTGYVPLIIAAIVILPLIGVLTSVFIVLYIMKRCNPYKNIMQTLTEKEIQEFLKGLGMDLESNQRQEDVNNDYSVELLAQNKPYNEAYEILRSNIKYDEKMPLGMGEFGVVYKGTVKVMTETDGIEASKIKTLPAAIKTVKPTSSINCLRSLLKEVKVMLYVGKHEYVVQMIGCCTENLRQGEILVLMEYCQKGCLETFLLKNRDRYKNIVTKGRLDLNKMNDDEPRTSISGYQNLEQDFDFFQLLQWCIEIAEGMNFLATRKVIHSDLATRNILLDDSFKAKISDFGLSKQLYCYTQYVKKRQEPLPWRWLAIESLKNMEFSTQSDVWSYGILCWEIFTLAEKPYPGVVWSDSFLRNLQDGLRLSKPKYTVSECYNLMIQCWNEDPKSRPSFAEILAELQDVFASLKSQTVQTNTMYTVLAV